MLLKQVVLRPPTCSHHYLCAQKKKKKLKNPQLDLNHISPLIYHTTQPHEHWCLPQGGSRNVMLGAGMVLFLKSCRWCCKNIRLWLVHSRSFW